MKKSFYRFKKTTTLSTEEDLQEAKEHTSVLRSASLQSYLTRGGDVDTCAAKSVTLLFDFHTRIWWFQDATIVLLLDRKPLKFLRPVRLGRVLADREL